MKAVILAAAPSERLQPFTETRPKPMIRVAGKTILENMTNALHNAGINEVVIVVNHKKEVIQSHFGMGREMGLSIDYVLQDPVDGIGSAVLSCREEIKDEAFLLIYGDVLTTGTLFEPLLDQYMLVGGAIAALSLPDSSGEFGNVYLEPDMRIARLVEKPSDPNLSNYVFAGMFVLPSSFFGLLEKHGKNIEMCFQDMIAQRTLSGTIWEGDWIDVSRPWHILNANRMLMQRWKNAEIHHSVEMKGRVDIEGAVHIEENVVIGSGSVLKGPCYIGRDSYIGNNTLIREYSSLGPESVVGYGTELKNCVLLGKSVLGCLSYIGDSVIGERVHLGTGVTTVNVDQQRRPIEVTMNKEKINSGLYKLGAFIGDDVNIGARHVLEPGLIIFSGFSTDDLITLRSN